MCKELKFKPLTAEQIEVKVTDTKIKGKATLLLYIDSRAAADILNEAVGVFNWQITYKDVSGQIYGALSIYDEHRNIWVTKEDTGEESNISEKKGQASDILKRCIARWGCDWLYRTPRIKITCRDSYYYNDKLTEKFAVKSIAWDETTKECTDLVVVDHFGNVVYDLNNQADSPQVQQAQQNTAVVDNEQLLVNFCKDAKAKGADQVKLKEFYQYWHNRIENNTFSGIIQPDKLWKKKYGEQ